MWNPESWLRESRRYGKKTAKKRLRRVAKAMLSKERWDALPKKTHFMLDDGS